MKFFTFISCLLFTTLLASVTLYSAELPKNIKWETGILSEPDTSINVKKGGIYRVSVLSYPSTFRTLGPNANSGEFNNDILGANCDFMLTASDPQKPQLRIPLLATHWAVMPDNKTVYYKLDKRVKWADGKQVTVDDYIFAFEMMKSPFIKSPNYNNYFNEKFESVEKINDFLLKIVLKNPSWIPLIEINDLIPQAKHLTVLDKDWVRHYNWKEPACLGPYHIHKYLRGKYVRLKRMSQWWGDQHELLKNSFNFEYIEVKLVQDPELKLQYFKKGFLTKYLIPNEESWDNDTNFDAVQKGWVVKKRIYAKKVVPHACIFLNLRLDLFKNKNFRQALQYLLDFDRINKNVLRGKASRIGSLFEGSIYETNQKPYIFNSKKAEELIKKAGWVKRGSDGILINSNGQKCSFSIEYGTVLHSKYLEIYRQELQKYGIEAKLKLIDGAKFFNDVNNKTFEAILLIQVPGLYPYPETLLHSKYAKEINNNNIMSFSNTTVDHLIDIYNKDMNEKNRINTLKSIDKIVHDEAFAINLWFYPYIRVLYHNYLGKPRHYTGLYATDLSIESDWWYDEEKAKILEDSIKNNKTIEGVNDIIDIDEYGLKK